MHADETRSLKRAALILLALSAVRWGWSARAPEPDAVGDSVLPELLEGTVAATEEGARRRAPLADDEKIDPNRADEVDLDRLPGVGPSTARAIVAARDSGAVFRRPEDLLDVRGIGDATLDRMRTALAFPAPPPGGRRPAPRARSPAPAGALVDLNRADSEALQTLPGVGPALAARILAARQERVFTSLDDLDRVPGIGPATLARLRPHATVGSAP
jgi:competence ComEA-like helix-hairpin-helix protein